ncbi:MAG TPA: hypothetical protein VFH47_05515, partial [Candidatus Thermoplasmatota archaeon]|nr:hypothetical protein [Candidatus Thermoplasmatota archaeon]
MQRGLPFLALLLLAMPGLAAVDPGAREQKLETDGGAISAIAVSPNGNILLGSRDPGSNTPPEATPDVRTWFYLQASGEQRASGSADLANCRTRVLDLCTSHVVSVALDGMGGRFAVASNVAASTDSVRGLVILGSSTGGETHRETFVEPIVAVDFDDDGDTLAVLTAPAVSMVPGSQPQSKVYVLAGFTGGSAPSGLTRLATDPLLDGAPRSLSIGGQGDQVVVGTSAAT